MTYEHGEPGAVLTLMEEEDERRREEVKLVKIHDGCWKVVGGLSKVQSQDSRIMPVRELLRRIREAECLAAKTSE